MKRKGQSISINTIIVAAIALAVLVVLFAIFTGRMGIFTGGVKETDTCAQKCASLNLEYKSTVSADNKNSPDKCKDQTYVPGIYKEGPYGCCCG